MVNSTLSECLRDEVQEEDKYGGFIPQSRAHDCGAGL
jgi:hypothetical protein